MTLMPLIYNLITDNQSIKKMNPRHPCHLRLKNHTDKLSFYSCDLLNEKYFGTVILHFPISRI